MDIKKIIIKLAITYLIFFIIDMTWLTLFMGNKFSSMVAKIQGFPMSINPFAGFIAYILLALGIYYFGVSKVDPSSPLISSLVNGGLFGLFVYGVFDFTNLAIFKDYEISVALMDISWGMFASAMTTYISYQIINVSDKLYLI